VIPLSLRRAGDLDPIFESLMTRLITDEPNSGYTAIHHIPELTDEELASVIAHVSECCPEDFESLIDADTLFDFSQALQLTQIKPLIRNAALGEVLKDRLHSCARQWLVRYADDECYAVQRLGQELDTSEFDEVVR
jgi:hypothetical protein